ncbi:UDP-glycosyltransferase 88F3-like [Macadamia integrifolia]|uniref:UDP-glycosyltransferase 88F3-like n=1 Tax=Macadamia integrifolia TaxID=60698 RepID=UPI001C4F4948|nr:UDP-glycosyltransferase 88F3-like [Macadamia integrifolia]
MQDTIVLYPSTGMGHLVSMVELGKLILRHNHHLSVRVLLTTSPHEPSTTTSYTNHITRTNPSLTFHRFPPLSTPQDTSPTRSGAAIAFEFLRLNTPNVLNALQSISTTSTIKAFVIDLFCTSSLHVASDLNIPTYYFFTSGAAVLVAFLYLPTLHKQNTQSYKDLTDTYFHFPGLPPIRAPHMPEPMLDRDDPAYHDFIYFTSHLPKSKGILTNTFEALEPKAIKVIAEGACVPDAPIPPVYYIGPLIADAHGRAEGGDGGGTVECLSWLDAQPSRSVVYLCFGSRGTFSAAQLKEIAIGLERSGKRFLWVVRSPPLTEEEVRTRSSGRYGEPDLGALLPEGFLGRTKDRGLVVKTWAPQVEVLSREAVGGFVTHCGWNSVLEAVYAGMPMVAWPLYAEQHLNRAVLVEDMKVAMPIEQAEDGFVSADEVEKRVRALMDSEKGREIREQIGKMRKEAAAAWEVGGTSRVGFTKLTESWNGHN